MSFKDNKYTTAVTILDSSVTIKGSEFINNTGIDGGAIRFECSKEATYCDLNLEKMDDHNTILQNNTALAQGGALYYSSVKPAIQDVLFNSNFAPYGSDIASYGTQILDSQTGLNYIQIDSFGSGQYYTDLLTLGVYDNDNQLVSNINMGVIEIYNEHFTESHQSLISHGLATFSNLRFIAPLGSNEDVYYAKSKLISDSQEFQIRIKFRN